MRVCQPGFEVCGHGVHECADTVEVCVDTRVFFFNGDSIMLLLAAGRRRT